MPPPKTPKNPNLVRVIHKAERHMRTYADLWHGAKFLIKIAKEDEVGSYYKGLSALVMLAFTIEAYCNYVGPSVIGDAWATGDPPVERFAPTGKLEAIGQKLGVEIDFGRLPWQRLREISMTRNMLAHAKRMDIVSEPKLMSIPRQNIDDLKFPNVGAPWDRYCTVAYLEKALLDIEAALAEIHDALGDGDHEEHGALFARGITLGSMSLVPDDV